MATRRLVPREDLEGSLGSGEKRWEKAYIGNVGNTYDTVADMIADLELMVGSTVITKGYHVVNDGGHGIYNIREKVVSDLDDGGSIIFLDNGNVAALVIDGMVNVKQFGAIGDGSADDTNTFRNAFAQEKPLFVPQGNYMINSNLLTDYITTVDNGTYPNIKPVYVVKEPVTSNMLNETDFCADFIDLNTLGMQGVAYNTVKNKFLVAYKKHDDSEQYIIEVDPTNYAVTATYTFNNLGHINSLAYIQDTDELYVITGGNSWRECIILNADDYTVVTTWTIPTSVSGISYDNTTKILVLFGTLAGNTPIISLYDLNHQLLHEFQIDKSKMPSSNPVANGVVAFDGRIIALLTDGIIEYNYYGDILNKIALNAAFEPEDACVVDGDIYISVNNGMFNKGCLIKFTPGYTKNVHDLLDESTFYERNHAYYIRAYTGGLITSGATELLFTIPGGKQFKKGSNVSVTDIRLWVRQDGYIIENAPMQTLINKGAVFHVYTGGDSSGSCYLNITFPSNIGTIFGHTINNNISVAVQVDLTLTVA